MMKRITELYSLVTNLSISKLKSDSISSRIYLLAKIKANHFYNQSKCLGSRGFGVLGFWDYTLLTPFVYYLQMRLLGADLEFHAPETFDGAVNQKWHVTGWI